MAKDGCECEATADADAPQQGTKEEEKEDAHDSATTTTITITTTTTTTPTQSPKITSLCNCACHNTDDTVTISVQEYRRMHRALFLQVIGAQLAHAGLLPGPGAPPHHNGARAALAGHHKNPQ